MAPSTKEQVLGDFVHRAVAMPFAKPQALVINSKGKMILRSTMSESPDGLEGETISFALDLALTLLWEAMNEVSNSHDRRLRWKQPLERTLDPGGPWWSEGARNYRNLTHSEQRWVRRRLENNVTAIGNELDSLAKRQNWQWIWSEVPLPEWGVDMPQMKRADLLVGATKKGSSYPQSVGYVIDLKVTGREYVITREYQEQLWIYRERLERMGMTPEGGLRLGVLFVDSAAQRPPGSRRSVLFKALSRS